MQDINETDDAMASVFLSKILKESINTFTSKPEVFSTRLEELAVLFNNVRSSHVNLHPMFMEEATWKPEEKAPMSYIHVFEDNTISVGIFILKPSSKLPLHNHPGMYGLLKVIAGTVNITSYSLNTEKTLKYSGNINNTEDDELDAGEGFKIVAERLQDVRADSNSNCCVLNPDEGNIHEIESIEGPAAFMDILSPPYDHGELESKRKCQYFTVDKELEANIVELQEIETPEWFTSDAYPYLGPIPVLQM